MYQTEIKKLALALIEKEIPYSIHKCWGGYQIVTENWDAICHQYSYGGKQGLLEIMGSIVRVDDDTVEGYLTAQDIIDRL